MELRQIVYDVIKTQIQFGAYKAGDILPTMENAAGNFLVSLDTVRAAYLRLQREGYATLSQNIGTMVIKDYSKQEVELHVQHFFSHRKRALIDLSKSLRPLLGHAQWIGLKNAPVEIYKSIEQLESHNPLPPFTAFNHIMQAYASLGNELLLRLVWQIFMFYEAPFFSMPENPWRLFVVRDYSLSSLDHWLRKDWNALRESIYEAQDSLSLTLSQLYERRITAPPPQQEIPFTWSCYKKASQICYSLAMDLLISICRGQYPVNTLLPSLEKLSTERNVSVSTVRRALSLLNGVGATRSSQRIGTRVLPFHETAQNCNLTSPAVRKRLLDMAQSLQILTLSCKAVSEITVASLDTAGLQKCKNELSSVKSRQQYELVTYAALELLERFAPYQAIRTVYGELMQQLFWGYALRSMWQKKDDRMQFYLSCFESFTSALDEADAALFSDKLEELLIHEFRFAVGNLVKLGIFEAERLLIPDL